MHIVFMLMTLISLFFLVKNVFTLAFAMEDYSIHKRRLKQLQFDTKVSSDEELMDVIDKLTQPVIHHILPMLKIKNLEGIKKDLVMSQWDKYLTAQQFIAIKIISKILGLTAFLLLFSNSSFMAVLWGVILFIAPQFLLNNEVNERRDRFMTQFPDFIRVAQGYLVANMPFIKAMEESIKFAGDEWKPILQKFVIDANLSGIDYALDKMKEAVNVFEVKEFVALIRLTLEQGGGAKEGFEAQAEKIQEMLYDVMMIKINKRRILSMLLQAPLMICLLATFGLPIASQMMNLGG